MPRWGVTQCLSCEAVPEKAGRSGERIGCEAVPREGSSLGPGIGGVPLPASRPALATEKRDSKGGTHTWHTHLAQRSICYFHFGRVYLCDWGWGRVCACNLNPKPRSLLNNPVDGDAMENRRE